MHELSFDKTMGIFDLIVSDMNDADKKNDILFRRICKEVFQKSYTKLKLKNNLNTGAKMLGVGITSLLQMASKKYEKGFFEKSVQKLNPQNNIPSYSDMSILNHNLEDGDFAFVVKLLKIQYDYGIIEAISSVSQYR